MASTIKVDTIENVAGSGNVSLGSGHNLVVPGSISGANVTAAASGAPLIVNSTNSNNNKIAFQNNGSAVSHLGGLSNGVVFGNAAGTQIGRLDGDGLKFGTDTAAANGLDDYEEGTYVPRLEGVSSAGTATYSQQVGRYTKVGNLVNIVGYLSWGSHTGTGNMIMRGLPYVTTQSGAVYNSLASTAAMASAVTLGSGYTQIHMYYPTYSSNDYMEFYRTGSGQAWAQVSMSAAGQLIWSFTYNID